MLKYRSQHVDEFQPYRGREVVTDIHSPDRALPKRGSR
jgi:hypothetical protein